MILKPAYRVIYKGRDITVDVSQYLVMLSYSDAIAGESDEVTLEFEDVEGLWKNTWEPRKGDELRVEFGYKDNLTPAGTFIIDEITIQGPPDTLTIKALATSTQQSTRTETSQAFEATTLLDIARKIAAKNGLAVEGYIEPDIEINRVTQNRETDLGFLRRIAEEYGYVFSIKGEQLIFTSIYELDAQPTSIEIDKTDISSYSIEDKTTKTYRAVSVSYRSPRKNKTVKYNATAEQAVREGVPLAVQVSVASAFAAIGPVPAQKWAAQEILKQTNYSDDTLELKIRAENEAQAKRKAAAIVYRKNTRAQTGALSLVGRPDLVAGVNFILTGLGYLSGKYQITKSVHDLSESGYTTTIDIKKLASPTEAQRNPR